MNQAHCFATGGSFDNGLPFSLSMGCGSWGGNSIDNNLHYRHFMNVTRVARPIASKEPSLEDMFADYWADRTRIMVVPFGPISFYFVNGKYGGR